MTMTLRYIDADPEIRAQSTEIDPEEIQTPEMQSFFDDLIDAMERFDGIGIAAPQVGHTVQAIIIHHQYAPYSPDPNEHMVLVNPRIVSTSERRNTKEEGCLSVPGKYGPIERWTKIRVKALDRNGNQLDLKLKGWPARVMQHEIDHLNGTLYVDNANYVLDVD